MMRHILLVFSIDKTWDNGHIRPGSGWTPVPTSETCFEPYFATDELGYAWTVDEW